MYTSSSITCFIQPSPRKWLSSCSIALKTSEIAFRFKHLKLFYFPGHLWLKSIKLYLDRLLKKSTVLWRIWSKVKLCDQFCSACYHCGTAAAECFKKTKAGKANSKCSDYKYMGNTPRMFWRFWQILTEQLTDILPCWVSVLWCLCNIQRLNIKLVGLQKLCGSWPQTCKVELMLIVLARLSTKCSVNWKKWFKNGINL